MKIRAGASKFWVVRPSGFYKELSSLVDWGTWKTICSENFHRFGHSSWLPHVQITLTLILMQYTLELGGPVCKHAFHSGLARASGRRVIKWCCSQTVFLWLLTLLAVTYIGCWAVNSIAMVQQLGQWQLQNCFIQDHWQCEKYVVWPWFYWLQHPLQTSMQYPRTQLDSSDCKAMKQCSLIKYDCTSGSCSHTRRHQVS